MYMWLPGLRLTPKLSTVRFIVYCYCSYNNMDTCMYMYMCVCVCTRMCVCVCTRMCVRVYVCAFIHNTWYMTLNTAPWTLRTTSSRWRLR